MKKFDTVLKLAVSLVWLCASACASSEYVIVNNNNYVSNTAILYKLDTTNGTLTKTAVLQDGGQGLQTGSAYYYQIEQAVTQDAGCIFVFDTGSSDIASFSGSAKYHRVGKYFNSKLLANDVGGTLALTPNGRFLYASYSETNNMGAWRVNSDCTLTFVAVVNDDSYGQIRVTPNGKYLVAMGLGGDAAEFAIDKDTGNLTYLGPISFTTGVCANDRVCIPYGLDITKDGKLVVFASQALNITRQYAFPVALTARITANGLVNPRAWALKNSAGLVENFFALFSAAGYAGSGNLYFGTQGEGGVEPGVLTTSFTERPLSFKVKNATMVSSQALEGNIAVTGNIMVVAEYPTRLGCSASRRTAR
jgi:lactonase family protein with 7-bladed beta-propeller